MGKYIKFMALVAIIFGAVVKANPFLPKGPLAAVVNGRNVTTKELVRLLELRHGKDVIDGLQRQVIEAALQELITFEIMEGHLEGVTITNKDYQQEKERYKERMFGLYENWGQKSPILFINKMKKLLKKNSELASKYKADLSQLYLRLKLSKQDRQKLREIWTAITNDKKIHNAVLRVVFDHFNMHPSVLKKRVLLTAKLRKFARKQLTKQQILQFASEEKFALSGGKVKMSHIMKLRIDPVTKQKLPEEQQKQVYRKLEKIRQKIKPDLSNFEQLAAAESEDSVTQNKGGNLGWVPRWTVFAEDLARHGYQLPPGKVSEIIGTDFGYHVIAVTKRKKGEELSPEKLRTKAINQLVHNNKEEFIKKWLKEAKIKRHLPQAR